MCASVTRVYAYYVYNACIIYAKLFYACMDAYVGACRCMLCIIYACNHLCM